MDLPRIGSRWIWEPRHPSAETHVVVAGVELRGEEWWVKSTTLSPESEERRSYWNELDRFLEAAVPAESVETREMCGLQTGPGEYCDDERMPFERRCAFHTLAEVRARLH